MLDPRKRPVLRVRFELADGSTLERDWCMDDDDLARAADYFRLPPRWLLRPSREWPHPQDPITLTGVVREHDEAAATEAVRGG